MTQIGAIAGHSGTAFPNAGSDTRHWKKIRSGNGLADEKPSHNRLTGPFTGQPAQSTMSQYETDRPAPHWYRTHLRAPFVAQLLGQVLAPAAAMAHDGAYRQQAVPTALLMDQQA